MTTVKQRLTMLSSAIVAVVVLLVWTPTQAVAQEVVQPGEAATVQVLEHEELGAYLTDEEGVSLYLFERDSTAHSTCYATCADAWPPLATDAEPEAGEGVDADLLGTMTRKDGTTQVTYNGWPLYYYGRDVRPGHIKGQDFEDYGAKWYLVSPEGTKVEKEEQAEE